MPFSHVITKNDDRMVQSVGQIIGEVLKQVDDEKFIVKASNGPRWVVGCRQKVRVTVVANFMVCTYCTVG